MAFSSSPIPDLGPGPWAAGVFLRRSTDIGDQYLLLRASSHGEWGFPKGHVEAGESLRDAAIRECAEEAGIALFAIDGPPYFIRYPVRDRDKQVVYYPAVTRQESIRLSNEHVEALWLPVDAVYPRLPHENLQTLFQAHRDRC